MDSEIKYYCDIKRHLICIPYSVENLHRMTEELDIKRCWFHRTHYDIPKERIEEIPKRCTIIADREIVHIIKQHSL